MKKVFDIAKILKVVAMFSIVFMLAACGDIRKPSTAAITPGADEPATEEEIEAQNRECWQASIIGTIYTKTSAVTMEMYKNLTMGALPLMMIAFAIWMSFQVMKHVSSFTEESPAELWTEVMKKFFVCLICGILATSTNGVLFVLNSIIFPIYHAFLELGSAMMSQNVGNAPNDWEVPIMGKITLTNSVCKASQLTKATDSAGFPDGPREMMECLACAVNERLNYGIYLGWKIIKLPGVTPTLCGAFVVVMFFFVKMTFAFYLVDAIFRFAMMVMILPLLIMSFAFKTTSKCAKIGFYSILNSAAFLMMIATVMIMIFAAIQQILNENKAVFEDESSFGDISVAMILLVLTGFVAVKSLNVAKDVCDKLVTADEGGDTNFQKRFVTFWANVGLAIISGGSSAAGKFALRNSKKLRSAKAAIDSAKSRINDLAGRNK